MGSHNVGPRNRAKEESELTHTHLSFKLWLWLVCFFIVFCGIASGSVLQTQHGVTQCWAEEQSQRRVWINTYPSILQTLTLTCLFFYCLLWHCLGSVLQTQHGVTQCWAEEQSQRRVWINTYPSILQTLTLTCLFFYCLLWHCINASNTAWGHNVGPWNGAKEESFLTHNHVSFKLWLWLFFFFIAFVALPLALCFKHSMGSRQCWAEEQSQRRVWINTYPSILQTLTLTCLFFYCLLWHCLGLCASNTAWGWAGTEPKKSLLTHNHLFFKLWVFCGNCLGLCASNTAWGHTMLGRGTEPKKSLN